MKRDLDVFTSGLVTGLGLAAVIVWWGAPNAVKAWLPFLGAAAMLVGVAGAWWLISRGRAGDA